jgi:four helix bundle protein
MRRAAVSITANIAEGFGRYHYKESIQFIRHARGSIHELWDHFLTCFDQKYISQELFNEVLQLIVKDIQLMDGFIRYMKKSLKSEVDKNKPNQNETIGKISGTLNEQRTTHNEERTTQNEQRSNNGR